LGVLSIASRFSTGTEDLPVDATCEQPTGTLRVSVSLAEAERRISMWDGKTLALSRAFVSESGSVERIEAYPGSYFDMLDSATALENEYRAAVHSNEAAPVLPERTKILRCFATPLDCLCSGGGVSAAIGGSVLVVFAHGGTYQMICMRRSLQVADKPGMHHVAPSFIFQPVAPEPISKGISLSRLNFLREYLEELFNVPEAETTKTADVLAHPNVVQMQDYLNSGKAEFRTINLAFNLANHRPELCMLLLIRDESWFDSIGTAAIAQSKGLRPIRLNSEFESAVGPVAFPIDHVRWSDIVKPASITPSGAAAVFLGVNAAAEALGKSVPTWLRSLSLSQA
jgi:hypothetical protein